MQLWSSEEGEKENATNSTSGEGEIKTLSFLDLLTIGVGSSLAVGIFVLLGGVIKTITGPAVVVSIFVAGATAFVGGLCFSEFGVRLVKTNSAYAFSYFWGRENAAFVFGWALILEYVAGTASAAKGIITFIDALTEYKITNSLKDIVGTNCPDVFPYFDFPSLGILVLLTVFIVFGLKDCMIVKKICTACSIFIVVYAIVFGALKADLQNWRETPDENSEDGFAPFGMLGIVKGTAVAFYGFIGFDRVSISGNEVRNQKRNIPAGILTTIFVTLLCYAGVGISLTLVLPYSKLNPEAALPFAFQEIGWIASKWVVVVFTFFGFQTSLFGAMFPLHKIIEAMANDCLLFPFLANSHVRFKIPIVATLVGGLLTAAAAGIFTFEKLVNLTVLGALFVYTILAINLTLLRYLPKLDDEEMLSGSWLSLINKNADVSVKAVLLNFFNFREKHPSNLTGIIITGNVIIFCLSSIGLGVIFNFFYEPLTHYSLEAVILAGVLVCLMFLNLLSMTSQPKSQEIIPFKVPLVPLVPCLSIFLNIFLMLTFGSSTWILFSCWMAGGILPYFGWRLLKCLKGEVGENSLYEINKTNAIKLNESIWKIKSDKKSFYEGALNPAFSDDLEDRLNEINAKDEEEVKIQNEKKSTLQLKQAEVIQATEIAPQEKVEPLESQYEVNFVRVDTADTSLDVNADGEKVQWECVAEIHSEEEFPQESVVLEIVDNTYNFLTEVAEELSKDVLYSKESFEESEISKKEFVNESENTTNSNIPREPEENQSNNSSNSEKTTHDLFREELLQKIELRNTKNNGRFEYKNEYSNDINENKSEENKEEKQTSILDFSKIPSETNPTKEMDKSENHESSNPDNVYNEVNTEKLNSDTTKTKPDEQNKVKIFKEKLNQLLKNHINSDATLIKNSSLTKPPEREETKENNEKNNDLFNNIKTLNKSQIRGKLEVLLSKGPPKRASLGNSFNIKIKDTVKESEIETKADENTKIQNDYKILKDEEHEKSLEENLEEKILPLKNLDSGLPKDICC